MKIQIKDLKNYPKFLIRPKSHETSHISVFTSAECSFPRKDKFPWCFYSPSTSWEDHQPDINPKISRALVTMEGLKVIYLPYLYQSINIVQASIKYLRNIPPKLLSAYRRPLIHPKGTESQYRDIKTEWAAKHFFLYFNEPFKVLSTSTATRLAIKTHEKYIVNVG